VCGECVAGLGVAYGPWRDVLRALIPRVERMNEAIMKRIGPVLGTLLPELWERPYMAGLPQPAGLDLQAAQQRFNSAVVRLLRAAAEACPTFVWIKGAHWADEATLVLLTFLARVPRPAGLLIGVAYNDAAIDPRHPLAVLSGGQVERLTLSPLSLKATADLVRSMLEVEELPPSFTERVHEATGGNPLFVQELIRAWAEEGTILRQEAGRSRVNADFLHEARLPKSLPEVVKLRLAHLPAKARQVLRWASIVGPVFWDGCVESFGKLSRPQVQAAVDEGLERALLLERTPSAFEGEREVAFANDIVQRACYETVPQNQRKTAHGQAAAWLIARGGKPAHPYLGLIAGHLEQAGHTDQAVLYLRQAGEQAAAQFANAEAVAYLNRALDLTPEVTPEHYALLAVRERVNGVRGAREAQRQDLAALQRLAETMGDGRKQVEVALRWANYAEFTSDYPAVIAHTEVAARLARTLQDAGSEADALTQWAVALWKQGNYGTARAQLERALTLAQEVRLRRVEADCLRNLGTVSNLSGDYVAAISYNKQSLDIYREVGYRQGEGRVFNNLAILYRNLGDYVKSLSCLDQGLHICREIGHLEGELSMQNDRCLLLHYLGDDQASQDLVQRTLPLVRELGHPYMEGYYLIYLGHALAGLGNLVEAADAYQRSLTVRREVNQLHLAIESLAGLARVSLAQGDLAQAQDRIEEILRYLEDHTVEGMEEPFLVYWTCYQVLRASQDPRAQAILDAARRLLQERAARITDEELRRSFLENVVLHRHILDEFAERQAAQPSARTISAAGRESREAEDSDRTRVQAGTELAEADRRTAELEGMLAGGRYGEEDLWEGEKPFRAIAETASDAIIIFDTEENIFFWNQAAQDIFGYWAGEARGRLLASILTPEFCQAFRQAIEKVAATGSSELMGKSIELTGVRQDGSRFPLELSLAMWKAKKRTFFTAIGRDITERKQAQEALQQAYEEVEKRVEERTAELQREIAERKRGEEERARLQQQVIEAQKQALQELSTPLVPLSDQVLVLPLVGTVDSRRAQQIMEVLLRGVTERRARVVILDITGVPVVDTNVANYLLQATQALRLVGAECVLVGITPEVAQTVVELGVDLRTLVTRSDLQGGIEYAQRLLKRRFVD